MGAYFILESYTGWEPIQDIHMDARITGIDTWLLGRAFDVHVPEPIEMTWDEGSALARKHFYKAVEPPLFHRDLHAALLEAGVDNLKAYRVRIRDPRSGEICEDYVGVNILGLVKAADSAKSAFQAHNPWGAVDTDFDSLHIDPAKVGALKLFRLAECVTGIVIHHSVKEHLERRGGFGLTFVEPERWLG